TGSSVDHHAALPVTSSAYSSACVPPLTTRTSHVTTPPAPTGRTDVDSESRTASGSLSGCAVAGAAPPPMYTLQTLQYVDPSGFGWRFRQRIISIPANERHFCGRWRASTRVMSIGTRRQRGGVGQGPSETMTVTCAPRAAGVPRGGWVPVASPAPIV